MIFSIAELSFASCKDKVLSKIFWLGIIAATPFSSAKAWCALVNFLRFLWFQDLFLMEVVV